MFPPNTDLAGKPKGGTVLAGNGPIPASVDARVNARNLALNRQFEQQQGGGGGAMTAATYTVKAGDTLSSIAKRMTGDPNAYRQIAAANGIKDPNKIKVGQVIRIGGAPVKSPTTPPVAPKSATGAKTAVATQLSVARPSASFSSGSSSGFRSSEQANRSGGFNDQIASGMRGL
jgi:LysM repeat protein